MSALTHVDLQVLPFSASAHPAMGQTFRVVRFPGNEAGLDFAYLENDRAALYLERPADVERYQTIFNQVTSTALSTDVTRESLARVKIQKANESRCTMDVTGAIWRKSSYSNGSGGDCVEVADLDGGHRAVRDSKNPTGPLLIFTPADWSAFTSAVRSGELD